MAFEFTYGDLADPEIRRKVLVDLVADLVDDHPELRDHLARLTPRPKDEDIIEGEVIETSDVPTSTGTALYRLRGWIEPAEEA